MLARKSSTPLLSFSILLLLGFIWGTGYSIARFAMTNGVSPFGYSFWQALGPAIIMGTIALFRRNKQQMLTIPAMRYYLVCGLTGIVIPNTSMYFAAPHLPASILAMIVNIVPIVAYPMALCAKLETFNWQRLMGIMMAFLGLMFIILPKSSLPDPEMVPWVLSTLITPLSFAFCSIYIARASPFESDSLTLAFGMLASASIMLIPMVIATHSFYHFHLPFNKADWIVALEIVLSSIGYVLFYKLIKIAGPVYYSLVDTIVVLTGLFWGYMIFGEQLNQWTRTALFFIVIALLLVTQQQRKNIARQAISHEPK